MVSDAGESESHSASGVDVRRSYDFVISTLLKMPPRLHYNLCDRGFGRNMEMFLGGVLVGRAPKRASPTPRPSQGFPLPFISTPPFPRGSGFESCIFFLPSLLPTQVICRVSVAALFTADLDVHRVGVVCGCSRACVTVTMSVFLSFFPPFFLSSRYVSCAGIVLGIGRSRWGVSRDGVRCLCVPWRGDCPCHRYPGHVDVSAARVNPHDPADGHATRPGFRYGRVR